MKRVSEEAVNEVVIRVHPAWSSFIKYCQAVSNGEIERLRIRNGLPVLAEEVKKKIKFAEKE